MALYDQEVARNKGTPNYQQLQTAVKLYNDQMMRNRNFKARNNVVERVSVTKSQKGNNAHVERKMGACFQWKHKDNVPKETPVVSDMTLYQLLETEVAVKDDRLLLHPIQRQNRLTKKKKAIKRTILTREVRFCVEIKNCNYPSSEFWRLPVCLNFKSEKRLCLWRSMPFPT